VHSPFHLEAEDGFSLLEIVIAMLLLALMAIGVLPLILSSVQTGTSNRSLVSATTFANAQLAELRAAFGNDGLRACSELVDPTKPDPAAPFLRTGFPDPAGTGLTADRTAPSSPCGAETYHTVTVTVTVHPAGDPSTDLVTLASEILVSNP
jgi:prepilin-type N-terminal cleavage/methylation domain-containing protein